MKKVTILFLILSFTFIVCKKRDNAVKYTVQDAEYLHQCEKKLTDIKISDLIENPIKYKERYSVLPMVHLSGGARKWQKM